MPMSSLANFEPAVAVPITSPSNEPSRDFTFRAASFAGAATVEAVVVPCVAGVDWLEAQAPSKRDTASVKVEANGFMLVGLSGVEEGKGVNVRPNVRVEAGPAAK